MKARQPSAPALRLAYSDGTAAGQPLRSNSSAAASALRRLALRAGSGDLGGFVIAFENESGGIEMMVAGSLEKNNDKAFRAAGLLCDAILYPGDGS